MVAEDCTGRGPRFPSVEPKGKIVITLEIPSDLLYTEPHSWLARPAGTLTETPLRTGVTPDAVDGLDIVAVNLPTVRTQVEAGAPCAVLWTSAWTALTVLAPIGGLVTLTNTAALANPRIVVEDPFGAGWLFAVLPSPTTTTSGLLTAAQYRNALNDAA
ncbi:MAG TPA: glycine cleavage system protein H [Aldersonia sp.]